LALGLGAIFPVVDIDTLTDVGPVGAVNVAALVWLIVAWLASRHATRHD
jgi:hypothetical protein